MRKSITYQANENGKYCNKKKKKTKRRNERTHTTMASLVEEIDLNPYLPPEERLKRLEVPIKREHLRKVLADSVQPKVGEKREASCDSTDKAPSPHQPEAVQTEPEKRQQEKKYVGRYTKKSKKERSEATKKQLFDGVGICVGLINAGSCHYGERYQNTL